jgi:hypothetical protein
VTCTHHPHTAACPLHCLHASLPARAPSALRQHLPPAATIADVAALSRTGELDEVRNIGPATAARIRAALARHAGLIP